MYQLILMIHVIIAVVLIGLILIQQGKGAEVGAAFGSGASNTVFGSQGTSGFLFKATGGLAMIFFVTSLALSYMAATQHQRAGQQLFPQPVTAPADQIPLPAEQDRTNNE